MTSLQRLGYRVRRGRPSLMGQILEGAGVRYRPANRAYPAHGQQIADCPRCRTLDALWISSDWRSFVTTCACWKGEGGPFDLWVLIESGRRPIE
jgi:hypothetical protein